MCDRPRRSNLLSLKISALALLVGAVLITTACVKTTKSAATLLKTYDRLPARTLIEKVNNLQAVNSLRAKAAIRLIDLKRSESGKIEPYRPADGLIVLQRPALIRLQLQVPIIKQNIADMVSDGDQFRIAIYYPEEYQRFLIGTNSRNYEERVQELKDKDKERISSFTKIRPQHITEALLIQPIDTSAEQSEFFVADVQREEAEILAGGRTREVIRTYEVLYLLERVSGGELRVQRQLWFDATNPALPLARMQLFNGSGTLISEISYRQYQSLNGNLPWPRMVEVVRARDSYAVEISFNEVSENDPMIGKQAFVLENKQKLPERDLDAPQPPRTSPER
ncbi:MAG: hypothetical protein AB1489_28630 [Acidobacteriota bacterium]